MSYYFSKTVDSDFDTTISKITEELKKEGFGVRISALFAAAHQE